MDNIGVDKVPIGAMKILSCYHEVQQILAGKMPVPRTMEFFLSNVCNHACAGCHSRYMHKDEDQFLDFDTMKEVVTDFAELGVEGVEISGGGEPLMYPQIIPAIAFMRSKGLKVGIFSNGTLLTEELSEFLVQNLLFLRIAFDAGTARDVQEDPRPRRFRQADGEPARPWSAARPAARERSRRGQAAAPDRREIRHRHRRRQVSGLHQELARAFAGRGAGEGDRSRLPAVQGAQGQQVHPRR